MKLLDVYRISISEEASSAEVQLHDETSWELLETLNDKPIISEEETVAEYLETYSQGLVMLNPDMEKHFHDLIHAYWLMHQYFYEGRRVFYSLEGQPYEEILYNKTDYLRARDQLKEHLQYAITYEDLEIRPIKE